MFSRKDNGIWFSYPSEGFSSRFFFHLLYDFPLWWVFIGVLYFVRVPQKTRNIFFGVSSLVGLLVVVFSCCLMFVCQTLEL